MRVILTLINTLIVVKTKMIDGTNNEVLNENAVF